MRIHVKSKEDTINLILPTALVFSKATVWLANKVGRKYAGDAMKNIPPEALEAIFAEFRQIKRRYGRWDLVEVVSADGDQVMVRL